MLTTQLLTLLATAQNFSPDTKTEEKLEPLFFARSPAKIKYAQQPPRINPTYEEIPTAEFAKRENFQWTDSMLATAAQRDSLQEDTHYPKLALTHLEQRLHNPLESLVICETGKQTGKGVFLSLDASPISCGTVIGLYTGRLDDIFVTNKFNNNPYRMAVNNDEQQNSLLTQKYQLVSVAADLYGNITRYIQDLPDGIKELSDVKMISDDPQAKHKIATANLIVVPAIYKGCPVPFLVAVRDIQPGEQLGFSYEGGYEFKKRCVFNTAGKIIGHFIGKEIQFIPMELKNSELAPKIDLQQTKIILPPLIVNPSTNAFDHDEQLLGDIIYILNIYENRNKSNLAIIKPIQDIRNCINQADSLGEVLEIIKNIFAVKLSNPTLQKMHDELIASLTAYSTDNKEMAFGNGRFISRMFLSHSNLPTKELNREEKEQAKQMMHLLHSKNK